MHMLANQDFIIPSINFQAFSLANHEGIIDRIKLVKDWSECARQARAACYISFTGFLNRRMQGIIRKAMPCKEGNNKTFYPVHEKVKSRAITQSQWFAFFNELKTINPRDGLIGRSSCKGETHKRSIVLANRSDRLEG
jgi:integrase/recombinase XerD